MRKHAGNSTGHLCRLRRRLCKDSNQLSKCLRWSYDLNARGSVKLIESAERWLSHTMLLSTQWPHSVTVNCGCHFVAELLCFLITSTLQYCLKVAMEYLGEKKFHKLTCFDEPSYYSTNMFKFSELFRMTQICVKSDCIPVLYVVMGLKTHQFKD